MTVVLLIICGVVVCMFVWLFWILQGPGEYPNVSFAPTTHYRTVVWKTSIGWWASAIPLEEEEPDLWSRVHVDYWRPTEAWARSRAMRRIRAWRRVEKRYERTRVEGFQP